jgi:hypothetical protein
MQLDYDDRPNREDLAYGQTIFTRGVVPLPRFLTGTKEGRAKRLAKLNRRA